MSSEDEGTKLNEGEAVVPNKLQREVVEREAAVFGDPLVRGPAGSFKATKGDGSEIWIGPRGGVRPVEGSDPTGDRQPEEEEELAGDPGPEPGSDAAVAQDLAEAAADAFEERQGETIEGDATELPDEVAVALPPIPVDETGAMLVPADSTPYLTMDRADEIAILNEVAGRTLEVMLYSFPDSTGKKLTDLSWPGVREVVRLMNERAGTQIGISQQPPVVSEFTEDGKRYIRAMVFAIDARFPDAGRWGMAVEPRMMQLRNGGEQWDKFAETKAINKAQRNALAMFIPEEFRQTIIATFLNTPQAVQRLKPVGIGNVGQKEPLMDERALAIKAEITELYEELVGISAGAMSRGVFNSYLASAERESHTRLEQFREHIRSIIDDLNKQQSTQKES